MMEDNYKVDVNMSVFQSGHHDLEFPNKHCYIQFDATDAHIDTVLRQFVDFLNLMGYVVDGKRLELVQDD